MPAGEIETLVLDALDKQLTNSQADDAQGRHALFRQIGLRVIVRS